MKRIDPATERRILDTADIVDVVSDYVQLRRSGANYMGLCPFHNERTPSFSVSPARNFCKCFSCGKKGSPVGFIMEIEGLSYPEALRFLAKKYHIEIEEREVTPEEQKRESDREAMFAVNSWAEQYFREVMNTTEEGRDVGLAYFEERGLRGPAIERFGLGYSLERGDALYRAAIAKGFTEDYLIKTGLCARTDTGRVYDRFRGRVIYPVYTMAGKVVAFGGRILSADKKKAKYVNSPESDIYNKSRELYGLFQAKQSIRQTDKAYLVEGYMDVISMAQSGVPNVVASSGTSLTTGQIKLLQRFTKNVTVVYDSDPAGVKASLRGIDMLLAEDMDVKILQFPEGDDPDSFARTHTEEQLKAYLATHERDFIAFKTAVLLQGAESDPLTRARAITDICGSIAVIPDVVKRTVYIDATAHAMSIDPDVIKSQVRAIRESSGSGSLPASKEGDRLQSHTSGLPTSKEGDRPRSHTPALAASSGQEPSPSPLVPYEKEVLRYIIRYGMLLMPTVENSTVLSFIASELAYDEMEFVGEATGRTFAAAQAIAAETYPADRAAFDLTLAREVARWRREGEEAIRARIADIPNLSTEEKRLAESVEAQRQQAITTFDANYLARRLVSSPDEVVRNLSAELVEDGFALSKVHARFANIATEQDRIDELVPRAIYELKDAHLSQAIAETDAAIRQAQDTGAGADVIFGLIARKGELLELKREFSRALGERIYRP